MEDNVFGCTTSQRLELSDDLGTKTTVPAPRVRLHDAPTSQCHAGGGKTDDIVIAPHDGHRLGEAELDPTRVAGRQLLTVEEAHVRLDARGAAIQVDEGIVFQGPGGGGEESQPRVEQHRRLEPARANEHLTATQVVHRHAAARAELEAKGVAFQGETIDSGVCHMAIFEDPDGNFSLIPYVYPIGDTGEFDPVTFQPLTGLIKDNPTPTGFFVRGHPYKLFWFIPADPLRLMTSTGIGWPLVVMDTVAPEKSAFPS